jgi:hypothetical protein
MQVVMPEHILKKVDEMRLKKRVFWKATHRAVVEEVLVKWVSAFQVAEVLFSDLVFQIAPMNELGEWDSEILIDVSAAGPELVLDQVEQRRTSA